MERCWRRAVKKMTLSLQAVREEKKVIETIALSKSCFNVGFVPW